MNEIIRVRKSIRKFDSSPLDFHELEKVKAQLKQLKPLYPGISYSIDFTDKTKGMFNIKAPHYLVFTSEEKDGYLENIGFIGQQVDLWLCENGLGSCWLGASKPEEKVASNLPLVICLALGKPGEPLHRGLSEFKRKALAEMSEGEDSRLEAARLAPSGVNAQNWYFIAQGGKIHCYRNKLSAVKALMFERLSKIDLGIALCHIAQETDNFSFARDDNAPERDELVYMGTVSGAYSH